MYINLKNDDGYNLRFGNDEYKQSFANGEYKPHQKDNDDKLQNAGHKPSTLSFFQRIFIAADREPPAVPARPERRSQSWELPSRHSVSAKASQMSPGGRIPLQFGQRHSRCFCQAITCSSMPIIPYFSGKIIGISPAMEALAIRQISI